MIDFPYVVYVDFMRIQINAGLLFCFLHRVCGVVRLNRHTELLNAGLAKAAHFPCCEYDLVLHHHPLIKAPKWG
ncbi:hypothetical protein, partial [Escherichia coli]|uniref:hypothetical protein n=1 Tax=Escherichia coli TaxID=562 RepID=UPI001F337220